VVGRVSERVAGHYVYGVNVAVSLASVRLIDVFQERIAGDEGLVLSKQDMRQKPSEQLLDLQTA
jgi:hypothetical protein